LNKLFYWQFQTLWWKPRGKRPQSNFHAKRIRTVLQTLLVMLCTDYRCDKGLCKCHGFGGEKENPTAAPLTA